MKRPLLALICLLAPATAWTCSCFGTASIQSIISDRPLLVEARAIDRRDFGVDLQVVRVLKGELAAKTVNVVNDMCYASMYPEVMQIGHTYLVPLDEPIDGRYQLAMCAESGLELIDGKLYSFELAPGGGRRLAYYSSYSYFQLEQSYWILRLWRSAKLPLGIAAAIVVLAFVFRKQLQNVAMWRFLLLFLLVRGALAVVFDFLPASLEVHRQGYRFMAMAIGVFAAGFYFVRSQQRLPTSRERNVFRWFALACILAVAGLAAMVYRSLYPDMAPATLAGKLGLLVGTPCLALWISWKLTLHSMSNYLSRRNVGRNTPESNTP